MFMNKKLFLLVFIMIINLLSSQSFAQGSKFDAFKSAQDAYKVYQAKKNKNALSLAYANIQLAIEENPSDYQRYLLAGLILNNMKHNKIAPQLALQHFEKAVELNPKDGILQYTIAQSLNSTNKSKISLKYYEKALWLDKNLLTPQLTVVLADTYLKTAQSSRGIYFFKNYINNNKYLPAYFILTAAYLMEIEYRFDLAKEHLKLILTSEKYSERDKSRAKEMLEGLE